MALLTFWKSNRDAVLGMSIRQIVASAGDGQLRDESQCASELRQFLQEVDSKHLAAYAETCLSDGFNESGLVLQDIVNEVGRRLEFEVENGLYRGKKSAIGFDGIWRTEGTPEIVIEVKTTDYIAMSLDKIATYKKGLLAGGRVGAEASVLIVVGREDSGALEAQIRGSRYAWEMRLISIESLLKLLSIKERSDDDNTVRQIKELLRPFEYTKVDKIIDVIFAAAEDVEQHASESSAALSAPAASSPTAEIRETSPTPRGELDSKRVAAVTALAAREQITLVKHRQALFQSADKRVRVCAAVSKRYDNPYQPYWYAFHPHWKEFLAGAERGYFLLVCMDKQLAYAIPYDVVAANLQHANTTTRDDGQTYWHIKLAERGPSGSVVWHFSRDGTSVDLTPFAVAISSIFE
jgi:hypothetical protein